MTLRRCFAATAAVVLAVAPPTRAAGPIPGIWDGAEPIKAAGGFTFTEGPAADAEGNLYFTDVRENRIHKLDAGGKPSTFLEGSQGCNGLMFDGRGRLIACQGGAGRIVAIDPASKEITVLADQFEGKAFERPNDLAVDRAGGVYFTDPNAGSVYYVGPDKAVALVAADLPRPNGVLLSNDEKTLYVLPSGTPDVMAYPVERPGRLGAGRVLCRLEQKPGVPARGGDGLTTDRLGNLYLTQPALSAVQVVNARGQTLGLIPVPEAPSNCTFGGRDRDTLYITARTSLYAVPMAVQGPRPAQPKETP